MRILKGIESRKRRQWKNGEACVGVMPACGLGVDGFRIRLCGGGEWRAHGGCARRSELCVGIWWERANTLVGGGEVAGSMELLSEGVEKQTEREDQRRERNQDKGGWEKYRAKGE